MKTRMIVLKAQQRVKCASVKLFSDSTQDAREEGRNKSQLNSTKKGIYHELARYIFENEADVAANWKSRPHVFVATTQQRHSK
jgi:post-segregation antitoxin (ccd killing protein)